MQDEWIKRVDEIRERMEKKHELAMNMLYKLDMRLMRDGQEVELKDIMLTLDVCKADRDEYKDFYEVRETIRDLLAKKE